MYVPVHFAVFVKMFRVRIDQLAREFSKCETLGVQARNRRTYACREYLHDAGIDLKPARLALDLLACIWN